MDADQSLTNHFLIAMPGLEDPNFFHTVTYICEHSGQGSMGIIVNRPMDLQLGAMLAQLDIEIADPKSCEQRIYMGGPVQTDRGFVLHSGPELWDSTLRITSSVKVTTSRDILEAIAQGRGPEHTFVALGYAGWAGGQLETEMSANSWLSGPADNKILFDLPAEQRRKAAARLLGVDLDLLSGQAGHA